jgi:ornithine decarboxylase
MSLRTGPSCSVNLEVLPRGMTTREFMKIKTQCSEREDPDDPFYVMNTKKLIDQYQLWVQTFPTIRPFYAVKCNDDPVLLSILAHLGTGFDCASKGEIRKILDLGVLPSDIIYANPCKQTSHIKYASKRNVSLMTFDNIFELYKVAANFNQSKLIVRICADDPNAICQLGAKFGCSVSEAYEMLHIAKELHLDVVGVSFHVGSGCQTPDAYRIALEMANDVFEYAESIGYQFTILDIGGGFPGSDKEFPLFKQLSTVINTNIVKLFGQRSDLHVIAEPGEA